MNLKQLVIFALSFLTLCQVDIEAKNKNRSEKRCEDKNFCGSLPKKIKLGIIAEASQGNGNNFVCKESLPVKPACEGVTTICSKAGEALGFDVSLATEIFRRLGIEIEFVKFCGLSQSFVDLSAAVIAGDIDASVYSTTFITSDRVAITPMIATSSTAPADVTVGVTYNRTVLPVDLPSQTNGDSTVLWKALRTEVIRRNLVVAANDGSVYAQILANNNIPYTNATSFPTVDTYNPDSVASALVAGKTQGFFDVFVTDGCLNSFTQRSTCAQSTVGESFVRVASTPFPTNIVGPGNVFRGWRFKPGTSCELLAAVQAVFDQLVAEGIYANISNNITGAQADFWRCVANNSTVSCFFIKGNASAPQANASVVQGFIPSHCISCLPADLSHVKPFCPGTGNTKTHGCPCEPVTVFECEVPAALNAAEKGALTVVPAWKKALTNKKK